MASPETQLWYGLNMGLAPTRAAVFADEKQEEMTGMVWGYQSVDLKTGATEMKDFAPFEVIMFSGVRNPVAKNELFGVYTQLSKHDVEKGELIKRVDLPHTYYAINIASDGGEVYVGGTNDDIGVYDAKTLEEVKRIPMNKPSGKYNVGNKIEFAEGTSH